MTDKKNNELTLTEIKQLNIYQKINCVMNDLNYLKKTASVGYGNNSYTAITHDYVAMNVQPLLVKYRIAAIPNEIESVITRYQVTNRKGETSERYDSEKKIEILFINSDKPDERHSSVMTAHGFDNQDKSPGKAASMAVKYILLKVFMIASGDDEETRIEDAKTITNETQELKNELKELLKMHDKLDSVALNAIGRLSITQLHAKINEYKTK